MSKVFFTKEITPESLIRIYDRLGVNLTGKVGVKVSTGERGSKGYLKADLIKPLVQKLNGTIIECNTAYPGARNDSKEHLEVAKEHGFDFTDIDNGNGQSRKKLPTIEEEESVDDSKSSINPNIIKLKEVLETDNQNDNNEDKSKIKSRLEILKEKINKLTLK